MTITSEITKLNTNLTNSYTACQSKGATMPTDQNFDNLATCIGSIQTGSTSTLITKNITANGTYNASSDNADGYSSVTVNVSGGGGGDFEPSFHYYDGGIIRPHFNEYIYSEGEMSFEQDDFGLEGEIYSIICTSWGRIKALSVAITDLYETYKELGTSILIIQTDDGDVFSNLDAYGVVSMEVYWLYTNKSGDTYDIYLNGANGELTNITLAK